MDNGNKPWHHSPLHIFIPNTMYIVTGSTINKKHLFRGNKRLTILQDTLFEVVSAYNWLLQTWAVFSNHYHFIAKSPDVRIPVMSIAYSG